MIRTQTNTPFDRGGHRSKCGTAGKRQRLAGLKLPGCRSQCWTERSRRRCKIRQVKDVENLRAKFKAACFGEGEFSIQDQVDLAELPAAQNVSRQIPKRLRLRNRKRCGVEQGAVLIEIRIDTRNQVGPSRCAR